MVEIEEILEEVENIKKIEDKIKYLEGLLKDLEDKELIESVNDILIELKFPQEDGKEIRFSMPEEIEEVKEERLENIVRGEEKEVEETKQVEYFVKGDIYENPVIGNIKRSLEKKGLFSEGRFVTDEEKIMIRDEIERYSPELNEERVNDYVNMIAGNTMKYEAEHVPVSVLERLDNELKKEKRYITKLEAK